jgi:hypothetical protein
VGFSRAKPHERLDPYGFFRTILEVMYTCFDGDRCIYAGLLKKRCIHLEKCVISGLYNRVDFSSFVCSCFSLNGPLSLLWEP